MNFRKGILAAATAVAVATSGVAAAEAAETTPTTTSKSASTTTSTPAPAAKKTTSKSAPTVKKTPSKPTPKDQSSDEGSSSVKDMSPAEIRDWIAVFTAVIGALGTLFAFLDKYLRK